MAALVGSYAVLTPRPVSLFDAINFLPVDSLVESRGGVLRTIESLRDELQIRPTRAMRDARWTAIRVSGRVDVFNERGRSGRYKAYWQHIPTVNP